MSILELRHIVKTYPNGTCPKMVLDSISCVLGNYGVIGLLGKNGAGKSTLIKCCTGLVDYEGDILYNGVNLKSIQKKKAGPNYYSALFEGNRNIYWKLTPIENIQYFSALRGIRYKHIEAKANYLLDILNLSSHKKTLIERLSRGMQQKVAIAMALCFNTPVTFLDEPTLGLDVESRDCLISYLKDFNQSGKGLIVVSSHDLDFISEVCKEILLLKDGKLINSKDAIRLNGFKLTTNKPIPMLNQFLTSSKNNRFIYNEIIDIADVFMRLTSAELQDIISVENLNMDIESLYDSNIR